jgi:hypothetical protein
MNKYRVEYHENFWIVVETGTNQLDRIICYCERKEDAIRIANAMRH